MSFDVNLTLQAFLAQEQTSSKPYCRLFLSALINSSALIFYDYDTFHFPQKKTLTKRATEFRACFCSAIVPERNYRDVKRAVVLFWLISLFPDPAGALFVDRLAASHEKHTINGKQNTERCNTQFRMVLEALLTTQSREIVASTKQRLVVLMSKFILVSYGRAC